MSRKVTREELIERFNKLYSELKRVPTREEMGYREPIKRLYSNYNNLVRELGHIPNCLRTKEDYINYIQKLNTELNKTPSLNDLKDRGIYSKSIFDIFSSYNNLLLEAGFETREKTYTDKMEEELLIDYIELCNELGRWATTREVESIDIYENRFGSIIDIRKLIVDDTRLTIEDKTIVEKHQIYSDKNLEKHVKDAIKVYSYNIKKN